MLRRWAGMACIAALALVACGGGGGGSDETSGTGPRAPLPLLVSDETPAGDRIDARSLQYFPAADGDEWTYTLFTNSVADGEMVRRVTGTGVVGEFRLTDTLGAERSESLYRRTADGLVAVAPMSGVLPPAAAAIVGDVLDIAEPFHAVGATRRVVRQGGLGSDVDGDAINDSFRLEITQVFVGFETRLLPDGQAANTAHFRDVTRLTVQPSNRAFESRTVVGTEDAWWAPGVGLVRAESTVTDGTGQALADPQRIEVTAARIGGRTLFRSGNQIDITLTHHALIYDATRSRYYASVPGSEVGNGNRIAIIDAATGDLTYSAPVGSNPAQMALPADGSALYVGLNGSGEVVKLRLPDFTELQRTRLPIDPFFGQLFAENISVSPVDPDVIAVSLFRVGVSPRHGGVALVRGGVLQPRRTQDHTGSNLVVFGVDGQSVYGFNNETSEFGLRRLSVLADGLTEVQVVQATGAGFGTPSLDLGPSGLVLGAAVYRSTDLALAGTAGVFGNCRAAGTRLVCLYDAPYNTGARLAVVETATFSVLAAPVPASTSVGTSVTQIVVGPPGQVALRRGGGPQVPSNALSLFRSTDLP